MKYAVKWLVLAGLVIGLLFLVRCLCAPFSSQIRRQMSRHRALHLIWAGFGLFTAFGLLDLVHSMAWPYTWLERRAQRERVAERVQSAGGWDSLRRNCLTLAERYKSDPMVWNRYPVFSNTLPAAVAALNPKRVEYYPPRFGSDFNDSDFPIIRITVFGAHSTGGRDIPWFGLDVVCQRSSVDYQPHRKRSDRPLRYWRYRKVADDVYEYF